MVTSQHKRSVFSKISVFALILLLAFSFLPVSAYADQQDQEASLELAQQNEADPLAFSTSVTSASAGTAGNVVSTCVADTEYLFLPTNANTASVVLNFETADVSNVITLVKNTGEEVSFASGETINLDDFIKQNDAWQVNYKLPNSNEVQLLQVMKSASIRSMYVISDDPENKGRDYVEASKDHSAKAKGTMLLVDPDGTVVYNGSLSQIKGRGNSTWNAAKKPYQIKLDKKTDLLETGNKANKSKTWVLLANAADPTLLKNSICYKLGQTLGLTETPECTPVDLYYDGEYRGSYVLCEKVQIGSGRVDITSIEDATTAANNGADLEEYSTGQATNKYGKKFQFVEGVVNPEDISGGYLIELDTAYAKQERCWFETSWGTFAIKDPENLSLEQMLYISEYVQDAISRCASNSSEASISEVIDIDSVARALLVNELCKNPDFDGSSTYFYLPASGDAKKQVLYGGPIWDFDTTFGVRIDGPSRFFGDFRDPTGEFYLNVWQTNSSVISNAEKEIFQSELLPCLKEFVSGKSSSSLQSFDAMLNEISASQKMNEVLWGITTFENCESPSATYAENTATLKSWISKRVGWMEKNFVASSAKPDSGSGTTGDTISTNAMYRLYNPNSGEHFYTADTAERDNLKRVGWKYEGVGWTAPKSSKTPVYRLYSGTDHHYTTDGSEKNYLVKVGWKYEGIGWYSDDNKGVPLYRQFNPNVNPKAKRNNSGSHNYTTSKAENDSLVKLGWKYEGIGWYGVKR